MAEEDNRDINLQEIALRGLKRARAIGIREFALDRSFGEFDYLGKADYDSYHNGAEVLRQIADLKIS